MRPGEFKILAALMNAPMGLTYTQLKQKTELSPPVLSAYLKGFVEVGMILKDPKDRLYFLAGAYQRRQNLLGDFERSVSIFMQSIPFEGSRIALVEDQDLRRRIYEDFFSFHMNNISVLLATAMRESVIQVLREDMKKAYNSGEELQKLKKKKKDKKNVKRFIALCARIVEAEMTQYHAAIQEKILNWIIPYIQMLALAYMVNAKFTLAGIDKELPQRFSKEAVEKTLWFRQLEAIDQEWARRDPEIARLLRKRKGLEEALSEGQNTSQVQMN